MAPPSKLIMWLRLNPDAIFRTNLAKKRERLAVAAEQHVLAVIDTLAGLRIDERGGASPEYRLGLEHRHLGATCGQFDGGTKARNAGAHDKYVGRCHLRGIITFSQVNPAIKACLGRDTRTS